MTNKRSLPPGYRRRFAARYLVVLKRCLSRSAAEIAILGRRMGQAAQRGGLGTLDLAILHERTMVALSTREEFKPLSGEVLRRAGLFFSRALGPLEEAQMAAKVRSQALQRRTKQLVAGTERLKREVARRKAGERAVQKGKERFRILFLQSQVMQQKLRQLARQVLVTQEQERKEISRELHDEVAQTLSGINIELAALSKGASLGLHALKEKISRTRRLVGNSVRMLHRFARDLRPTALDDLGLIPALHAYNKSLAARKKIRIELSAFGGVEELAGAKRTVLYRVAQEPLTNVARHAQASEVKMRISDVRGGVCMEISDNGRSFNVERAFMVGSRTRLGLIGMRERVEMIGGTLSIESEPGRGTTVRAQVPFAKRKIQP